MGAQPGRRLYRVAWCLGGFLFPAAIMAIGLAFHRDFPWDAPPEVAGSAVHPDVLSLWVNGLALGHLTAGTLAVARWHDRWAVLAATAAQLGCTLYCWLLATMAVQGTWL